MLLCQLKEPQNSMIPPRDVPDTPRQNLDRVCIGARMNITGTATVVPTELAAKTSR